MKINFKTLGTLALTALIALSASAANFAGKKYYVNPGHGGHDSDDRPTPLPLGVEIFYESDGTLSRGLFLRDFFQAYGAEVKMSRTTNYSSDDLALSTIASQANSYGGYFMSLHTNGANASANYIVSFYRQDSKGAANAVAGSKDMATAVSKWHDNNHLTNLTYTTPRALGCMDFYGYNLGVLKPNNRPGYLVETVFHDYRPDGLRLKSDVYNRYTAWQILMAAREKSASSAGMTDAVKGCIVGDIRDLSKSCGYTNYTTRGRDSYLAVNGATVVLRNSSGAQVATMTTDNCANGLFGFFELTAGTYTLEFSKTGYKTQTKNVTVSNNASTKVLIDFVQGANDGISVTPGAYSFNEVTLSGEKPTTATAPKNTFSVTGTSLSSNITVTSSNPDVFPVSKSSLSYTGTQTFDVYFMPEDAGNYTGTITLKSGSYTSTVTVTGSAKNPPLAMETGYNFGETSGQNPAWLPSGGWGLLRNMCFGDGKLYIVNASESIIYVVKAQTGELIKTLDMTGVSGGTLKVMDVKYVNGKVIACNLASKADEPVKVYVWDNDDAQPRCILNTTSREGVSRLGDTFDIDGNLANGRFLFAYGGTDGDDSRMFAYSISDGTVATTPTSQKAKNDDGSVIKLGTSPRAVADENGKFWVMGQQLQPTLIGESGVAENSMSLEMVGAIQGNDFKRFHFKGTPYALVTTYAPAGEEGNTENSTLTRGGARLIDCTNGWNDGESLAKYPAAGLGMTRNTNFSTSVDYNVNGENGVEFWVLVTSQGLAYFKHGTTPVYTTEPTVITDAENTTFEPTPMGETTEVKFNVQGYRLTKDITITVEGEAFDVTPKTISTEVGGGDITVTFSPTDVKYYTGTLTISSPEVEDQTFNLGGQGMPEVVGVPEGIGALAEVWNTGSMDNSWLSSSPQTRSIAVNGNDLYVLNSTAFGSTEINIVDVNSGEKTSRTVDVSPCTVGGYKLSHLEMLGDKLYATNGITSATTPLTVWKWDDITKAPTKVLEYTTPYTSSRLGEMMGAYGDENNGRLMFAAATSDGIKLFVFTVNNGTWNTTPTIINVDSSVKASTTTTSTIGVKYVDGNYLVMPNATYPTLVDASGKVVSTIGANVLTSNGGTDGEIFKFGKSKYLASTSYLDSNKKGVLDLLDITDGYNNSVLEGMYPADGLGTTANGQIVTDVDYQILNNGTRINLFVCVPAQGVAMYTYKADEVELPTSEKAHFAYGLKVSPVANSESAYNISFKSTGDAYMAFLLLEEAGNKASAPAKVNAKAASADEPTYVHEQYLGAVSKGENNFIFDFDNTNLDDTKAYKWTIRVHNFEIEEDHATQPVSVGGARAAVACFTDPNFPDSYGYTVIGRATNTGIDIYDPEGNKVQSALHSGAAVFGGAGATNPMNATTRGNEVYFANWNDKAYGVVAYDVTTPAVAPYSVYNGTLNTSNGLVTASNGNQIGGGTPCVGIWGEGDQTSIITFDEDVFTKNVLTKNVIGTAKTTNKASQLIGTGFKTELSNTNVDVCTTKDGMFVSQIRGTATESVTTGLMYVTMPEGNKIWQCSDDSDAASKYTSTGAGIDIHPNGTMFAQATYTSVRLYDLAWATDGKPVLTFNREIPYPFGRVTNRTNVKFDPAGNLHCLNITNGYFKIYLAHQQPVATTTATTPLTFVATGVSDVRVDAENDEPVFYNINGVRMADGENLAPGVYVKVVGKTVTKVVVK